MTQGSSTAVEVSLPVSVINVVHKHFSFNRLTNKDGQLFRSHDVPTSKLRLLLFFFKYSFKTKLRYYFLTHTISKN